MNRLGHGKVILKNCQEPAIVHLQRQVREEGLKASGDVAKNVRFVRGLEDEVAVPLVVLENSPKGEPRFNGATENAIKRAQGQIGTVKF